MLQGGDVGGQQNLSRRSVVVVVVPKPDMDETLGKKGRTKCATLNNGEERDREMSSEREQGSEKAREEAQQERNIRVQ